MECLLPYLRMVTVPHIVVGLERMVDYRGVGLVRFHCILHRTVSEYGHCDLTSVLLSLFRAGNWKEACGLLFC